MLSKQQDMKVFIKKVIGNGYYRANYSGVDVIFKE